MCRDRRARIGRRSTDTGAACGGCWDMERALGLEIGLASDMEESIPGGVSCPPALARGVVLPLRLGNRRGEEIEEKMEVGDGVLRPMLLPLGVEGGRPAPVLHPVEAEERSQTETVCIYKKMELNE